jgi:hypothetical protein
MAPVQTFIVRVWAPSPLLVDEVSSRALHGHVEPVGSPERLAFRSADDLIAILRRPHAGTDSESPEPKEAT